MTPEEIIDVLAQTATAVRQVLDSLEDWGLAGTRPGQYHSDLAADNAAVEILTGAGMGVLSEESGLHDADRPLLAVIDPVDGSTNASRRIPWYATSICVVDAEGPLAALVVNQATGTRYQAARGGGAEGDGVPIKASSCQSLDEAIVGLVGWPPVHLGWRQMRALGAVALDLCAVAAGQLDAVIDCSYASHGVWDYLAGVLICQEAGAHVADGHGRPLVIRDVGERRVPVGAATPQLLDQALAARASFEPRPVPTAP